MHRVSELSVLSFCSLCLRNGLCFATYIVTYGFLTVALMKVKGACSVYNFFVLLFGSGMTAGSCIKTMSAVLLADFKRVNMTFRDFMQLG